MTGQRTRLAAINSIHRKDQLLPVLTTTITFSTTSWRPATVIITTPLNWATTVDNDNSDCRQQSPWTNAVCPHCGHVRHTTNWSPPSQIDFTCVFFRRWFYLILFIHLWKSQLFSCCCCYSLSWFLSKDLLTCILFFIIFLDHLLNRQKEDWTNIQIKIQRLQWRKSHRNQAALIAR